MPESYTVKYAYQGQLKEERVYADNGMGAVAKLHDRLRTAEPLFINTFQVKEVKRTYETPGQ